MRRAFVHFLEEIEDTKKTYRNYLTFIYRHYSHLQRESGENNCWNDSMCILANLCELLYIAMQVINPDLLSATHREILPQN